jgi:hypothetical protein
MEITHRKDRSQRLPNIYQIIISFKSKRLTVNIKLALLKALIRSVMTYACPTWEISAQSHLLKLQRLQNRVLPTTGYSPRRTSVREFHVTFQISHVYYFVTKFCTQQAEAIQKHDNKNVRNIVEGDARHRKYKRLKLGGGHVYEPTSV